MIEAIVFLLLSLLLLFLEFYLPGGILAFIAAVTYIVSVVFLVKAGFGFFEVLFFIILSLALAIGTVMLAMRRIRKSADSNTFYLSTSQEGYVGASADISLIGKSGITKTDLGPSGFAEIEGHRVQVVSSGPYIERGEKVLVLSARGAYLVVQKGT